MSSEPILVEPCKGWTSSCSFCNKRFSDWKDVAEEEVLETIPDYPVAFMLALENKQQKEVVVIGTVTNNCQQYISKKINSLRQNVSQRKSKDNKSTIFLRYMNLPQAAGKDACTLYAHWYNYTILPRFTTEWPGEKELRNTGHYHLSNLTSKWYHNAKEAVWRKSKTSHGPKAVKKCKWTESCLFCDSRFTPWIPLPECREMKLAPDASGFVIFAAKLGNKHKVYRVDSTASIARDVKYTNAEEVVKRKEKSSSDVCAVVRWMARNNIEDDDSCLIYAHWYNADEKPYLNVNIWNKYDMEFGEKLLLKNTKFSFRTRDKQWCYQADTKCKPSNISKTKEKKYVQQSIEDELIEAVL